MARDVNWWLMSLAFLLGLLLTLALTIRKVTREVPVSRTVEVGKPQPVAKLHEVAEKVHGDVHAVAEKVHGDVHAVAEKVHGDVHAAADKVHDDVHTLHEKVDTVASRGIIEAAPYGAGSIRVTRRSSAPAGYRLKGVEKTRRYYTPESRDFNEIETELWFLNEESAEKAGFVRWNAANVDRAAVVSTEESATVVTEVHHVAAETLITEAHSAADSTLVIVDDGIPEAKIVIVDDGIPEAESRIRIIGVD